MDVTLIEAIVIAVLEAMPWSAWDLDEPRPLPGDVMVIADPNDPLAQSRLWGALYPEIPTGFLVETCLVESGCREAIGVHPRDQHLGESSWRGVWKRRRVSRECPFYTDPKMADRAWFEQASTRGNHGLNASYHIHLLGPCVPLEVLDVPFFSAWASAEKARRVCSSLASQGKRCTRERLRCAWAVVKPGSARCAEVMHRFRSGITKALRSHPDLDPREPFSIKKLRKLKDTHGQ